MKSSHRHLAVSNGITGVGRRPREETDGWVGWGGGGGAPDTPGPHFESPSCKNSINNTNNTTTTTTILVNISIACCVYQPQLGHKAHIHT